MTLVSSSRWRAAATAGVGAGAPVAAGHRRRGGAPAGGGGRSGLGHEGSGGANIAGGYHAARVAATLTADWTQGDCVHGRFSAHYHALQVGAWSRG